MSLSIPKTTITQKNTLVDSDGNKIEFRLHDNKLYVMKMETNGSYLYGAEMLLDPLPDDVLYGSAGNPNSTAIEASATLDTTPEDFIANNQQDFIDTMNAETGGSTEVEGVDAGSAIVRYSVYFDDSVDASAIDALTASLDTDAGIQNILAKSSTLTAVAAAKTPGTTTGKVTKKVAIPKIVSASVSDSVLSIKTVGAFNSWGYKYAGSDAYTALSPGVSTVSLTPPSMNFTITIRLMSPDNDQLGIPKTLTLSMLPVPIYHLNPKVGDGQTYDSAAASDLKELVSGAIFAVGANSNKRWQSGGSHAVYEGAFTDTEHAFSGTPWGSGQRNQNVTFDSGFEIDDETTMPAVLAQLESSQEFTISYWFRSTINYKSPPAGSWYESDVNNNASVSMMGDVTITHFLAVPDSWTSNYSSTKSAFFPGGGGFSGLANGQSKYAYQHCYASMDKAAIYHLSDAVLNSDGSTGWPGQSIVQGSYNHTKAEDHEFMDSEWHCFVISRKTGQFWKMYVDGVEYKDLDAAPSISLPDTQGGATFVIPSDAPMRMANVGHGVLPAVGGGVSFRYSGLTSRETSSPGMLFADFRICAQAVGQSGAQGIYDSKKDLVKTNFVDQPGTSGYWGPWVN